MFCSNSKWDSFRCANLLRASKYTGTNKHCKHTVSTWCGSSHNQQAPKFPKCLPGKFMSLITFRLPPVVLCCEFLFLKTAFTSRIKSVLLSVIYIYRLTLSWSFWLHHNSLRFEIVRVRIKLQKKSWFCYTYQP